MTLPPVRDRPLPSQPQTLWAGLGTRVLSSLVLGTVALAAAHLGGPWFLALLLVLALLLLYEWGEITGGSKRSWPVAVAGGAIAAALGAGFAGGYGLGFGLLSVAALGLLVLGATGGRATLWTALAVPYIGAPALALAWLRFEAGAGLWFVYWLLVTVWATDTGAYLVGRLVGGPRLAPRISPKKTWSGLAGGAVAAGLAGFALSNATATGVPLLCALASIVLGLWSQVGDLFESAVKRYFGVKDASRLIPGHGGFLDRVDGLLFAAPVAALGVAAGLL